MSQTIPTEADLDEALAAALKNDAAFASWFLGRTPLAGVEAACTWCRSDHPWSRVTVDAQDGAGVVTRECETDVLAVFESRDGRRLALHIENKLAGGAFTELQPDLYRARKEQWQGRPLLGDYTDAATVLVAPKVFQQRNVEKAAIFDAFISHEDLAAWLPLFRQSPSEGG